MRIRPVKRLHGEMALPGDKSISHRALMLGAIAKGITRVRNILDCDDCDCTIRAFRRMGTDIAKEKGVTLIEGKGLKGLLRPQGPIDVGASGTSMRLIAGILAGQGFEASLVGDESLSKRPMDRIIKPLSLMGLDISSREGGYPPLIIKGGRVSAIDYKLPVPSAQVKSAILFAALYTDGTTTVEERFKSRDHTERMMKYFGADLSQKGSRIYLKGGRELEARSFGVPGDISSASFFIVGAAVLDKSKIRINNVSINPTRAGILAILSKMGARLKILNRRLSFEPFGDIEIVSGRTKGLVIERDIIPSIIDELPILFVLASLSEGRTVMKGVTELKVKETDRIRSMKENLERMGARLEIRGDDVIVDGVKTLKGASLRSFGDHRTCMAVTIAALAAEGESTIDDVECVSKSFPAFFDALEGIKE